MIFQHSGVPREYVSIIGEIHEHSAGLNVHRLVGALVVFDGLCVHGAREENATRSALAVEDVHRVQEGILNHCSRHHRGLWAALWNASIRYYLEAGGVRRTSEPERSASMHPPVGIDQEPRELSATEGALYGTPC